MSKFEGRGRAMAEEDWRSLREEVISLFSPGSPIDEVTLFAGRQAHMQKLRDVLFSKGRHAVLFGERGVGKTSLVNIFHLGATQTTRIHRTYTQCAKSDDFRTMWLRALKRMRFNIDGMIVTADKMVDEVTSADDVETALSNYGPNDIPIIIFDEFDRVKSAETKAMMASTIKQISNTSLAGMIILIGVADNITELIEEHSSVARQLVQIQMPRMTTGELREIVAKRLNQTSIKITDDALWRISYLASGLPFYAHALGQAAAIEAIDRRHLTITEEIVRNAIPKSFAELDHSILDSYVKGTVETRKGNIFKEVLAACALADQDELGRFSAASVEAPLSAIMGREMKAPSFSFHLNELCDPERGSILRKAGSRSHFRFRFNEPLMQPYVTIKSLATDVITSDILSKFSLQRQRELPI